MKTGQWLKFAQWHKMYGQFVISDRRAVIYSDRPRKVIACDIMTGGLMLGFATVKRKHLFLPESSHRLE